MTVAIALLAVALVVGLLALLLLLHVARGRARRARGDADAAKASDADPAPPMQNPEAAFSSLAALLPDSERRYQTPLVLLAGDSRAGKSTLLETCGLGQAATRDRAGAGALTWYAFDHGVVLEAGASYLGLDRQPGAPAKAWDALADAMQRYRPRRPVDAVIVAVGADVLAGPHDALERLAEQMQRRLARMQVQFGLRVPLFVVITKADLLPGFASFADALPAAMRNGMLGWSNPNGGAASFSADWAGQAFDAIGATVSELSCEIMAGNRLSGDRPGLLAVASALDALRAPAAAFLARVAGAPEPHRAPLLRGVYVTGSDGRRALFVKDLLACKVFAERGMAQALPGQVWARDRRVRAWRLATVALVALWLPALVWSDFRLRSLAPAMLSTLELIRTDVRQAQQMHAKKESLPLHFYRETSRKVIDAILAQSNTLVLYAIPASWHWPFSDSLDSKIEERFADGVREILLPAIGKGLNQQVAQLTGAPSDKLSTRLIQGAGCASAEASEPDLPFQPTDGFDGLEAFRRLSLYVDKIEQVKKQLAALDELQQADAGTLAQFAQLARFTNAFQILDSELAAHPYYLRQALLKVAVVNPDLPSMKDYMAAFDCGLDDNHNKLTAAVLSRHPLLLRVDSVDQRMHGAAPTDDYARLQADLLALKQWLAAPGTAWLHTRRLDFGGAYAELLARIDGLNVLGTHRSKRLRALAAKELAALEAKLLAARDPASAVLQRSDDAQRLEMTAPVAHMEQALSALMNQPFMAAPAASGAAPGERKVAFWDLVALNKLLDLVTAQRNYMTQALGTFPPSFQPGLRQFADARFTAVLVAGVAAAQGDAPDPAAAYLRLGQAHKPLLGLLDGLARVAGDAERQLLAARLAAQADAALAGIDADFDTQGAYLPKSGGFAWWSGSRNPAAQGYTGGDAVALEDYLAAQLAMVERSAALARPVLALYLDSGGAAAAPRAKRWSGIVKELDKFAEKAPAARIAALHAFIRGELSELDQQNCQAKPLASSAAGATDFFGVRMRELGQRAAGRCAELARSGGSAAYATLAGVFRSDLANKFPFSPINERNGMAAEPDDVAAFLQSWERLGVAARQLPLRSDAGDGAALVGARRFLASGDKVLAFLAPLVAAEPGAEPGYDLRVRFRVSERGDSNGHNMLPGEVDGNRIAEWTLQVGDQVLRFRNGEQSDATALRWRIGMPVNLTLRWADNAPVLPRQDGADPYMRVSGREVRYQFGEPWSLLRLLGNYRVDGARGETLRFEIPLAAGAVARNPARVFVRLALSPANKKNLLAFPAFPVDAPALGGQVLADATRPGAPLNLQTGTAK